MPRGLMIGDTVDVIEGPLKGTEGTVQECPGRVIEIAFYNDFHAVERVSVLSAHLKARDPEVAILPQ